jgi:uncharacterized coiled-coil DUF342 family protein
MEGLSTAKKVAIIRHYLAGLSYSDVALEDHVSTGTVANVVADLKAGKFPEAGDVGEQIEQLRELSVELKQSQLSPGQCTVGLAVLARINKYGLDPADIDRWPVILKAAGAENNAQEFVRLVYSIQEVQKKAGLSLEDLDNKVHELEQKATDMEPMTKQYDDYRQKLTELTKQRENLVNEVSNLEQKYNFLNPRIKDMEKRDKDLLRRIQDMATTAEKAEVAIAILSKDKQKLLEVGLSLESLDGFNQRVQSIAQRHQIKPPELRERLLRELANLDEGLGLETLIQKRQTELEEQKRAVVLATQEQETLKIVVAALKQEKGGLEASIKEIKDTVCREMTKIVPITRDTINKLVEEVRHGRSEALTEVNRLKDDALEVGKEIGRFEGILQTNQWLSELPALVRGEESVTGKSVRVIILLILRGTAAWIKNNGADTVSLPMWSYTLDNLIKELEQWKV